LENVTPNTVSTFITANDIVGKIVLINPVQNRVQLDDAINLKALFPSVQDHHRFTCSFVVGSNPLLESINLIPGRGMSAFNALKIPIDSSREVHFVFTKGKNEAPESWTIGVY
jgi:hypothetical protein